MKDQFDLKKFLIENKLTNSSLREEDEDWNITVGEEWNVQELGVGDYITPEMFQDNKYGNEFKALNQDFKIVRFKVNNTTLPNGDINTIYYFNIEYKDRFGKTQQQNYQVKSFNKYFLKPQYKVVPPDDLNEQEDDEWDFATDAFDVQELTVGDKITPEMWDKKAVIDAGEEDEFLNDEIWTINDIRNGWGVDMTSNGGGSIGWNIDDVQALLKPQYKIVTP